MGFFSNIFKSNAIDLQQLLQNGAIVVDVRTSDEFKNGHVPKSINIPLNQIQSNMKKLKKDAVIIVCCRSGNRSGMAQSILKNNGFSQVYNGGSWQNVNNKLK